MELSFLRAFSYISLLWYFYYPVEFTDVEVSSTSETRCYPDSIFEITLTEVIGIFTHDLESGLFPLNF